MRRVDFVLGATLLALAAGTACGGSEGEERSPTIDLPRYSEDGLRIVYSDLDHDGIPEVLKYFATDEEEEHRAQDVERRLVRTEIDLTGDGIPNMRREYDELGELTREEFDGNFDGRIDHVIEWEEGLVMRSEQDENHDGRSDVFRVYRHGHLSRIMRDTNFDGTVDTWSYYDRFGLVRVGYDTDRNGEADYWVNRPEGPPTAETEGEETP
jgi:hypothetical protein